MQMARGNIEGGYNLAVGEPVLLQQWLRFELLQIGGPFPYPTMDGHEALLKELRVLHPRGEIVVTNGAKQALSAAFYALKNVEGRTHVWHGPPYWPSYPTLARMAGLEWGHTWDENVITCVTAPNNPDGGEYGGKWDIWDAVYAHWVYGWSARAPKHRVAVYSSSKLLGLSGARVGWLVTEDKAIANEARKFVEFTTSGVSVISQAYVAHALELMRKDELVEWKLRQAREDMLHNSARFRTILGPYVRYVAGMPALGKGMFAWFQTNEPERFQEAIQKAKVALVTGTACGDPNPGMYRMNMAQDCQYTHKALLAIKENY